MRQVALAGAFVAAIAVAGLTGACDSGPGRMVGPDSNGVVGLEISGPASIPPGRSAQYTAIFVFGNGTSQTATNVRWSSRGLIRVDTSGLATAGEETGEDLLHAVSQDRRWIYGSREITVLREGTYRMIGVVTENGSPSTPITGARIEVTSDPSVAAVTDWDGRYRLYGVPPMAEIRVMRDGYEPHVQSVQLTDHATQDFQLTLSGIRLDLAGPYTLAIDVECGSTSTPVPADQRHLRYAATLTRSGSTVEVVLTESTRFRVNSVGRGDRFTGHVDAAGATFNLGESFFPYYAPYDPSTYPNIVERLSNGTFLAVDGRVLTLSSAAGLLGSLQGFVSHFDSTFPSVLPSRGSSSGTCYSLAHRFALTPR